VIGLAVMGKRPVPGRVKTRLCPPLSPDAAADLAECLLRDAVEQVRRIPGARPALAYDPPEAATYFRELAGDGVLLVAQAGADLGLRMHGALARLLAEHPGAVLLGADMPGLPDAFLAEAVTHLDQGAGDVVVGPSADGGYYLIGLRAPAGALFEAMSWGTPAVLEQTLGRARDAALRVHLLPPWHDLDSPADLARLKGHPIPGSPSTAAWLRRLTIV
jgi:rSAM/selenodomain-associated transferase 1